MHTPILNSARWLDRIFTIPIGMVLCAGIALTLWLKGSEQLSLEFASAALLVGGVVGSLKILLRTERPARALVFVPLGAFPSGHAAVACMLAVTIPYILGSYTAAALCAAAAAIVCTSRLILHVHTPLQVLAGATIGIVIPLLVLIR